MALKDLVADRSKLTEEAIESIVRDYVRYDPGAYEIVLTPAGLALSNDAKVLVVLVALAGWKYVVDEPVIIDTKPAALEAMTGIPGGTLRPTLKKLKDSHLVATGSDGYSVRVANLDAVGRVVAGDKAVSRPAARRTKRTSGETAGEPSENDSTPPDGSSGTKKRRRGSVPIVSSLNKLIDLDFFGEDRTLSQVASRLHEMAIIAKTTSLSGPIAVLVRDGKLTRKKVADGGKEVWTYRKS